MTFRRRLTLASAAAVAVAVATASIVTWFFVRSELRSQIDESLRARLPFIEHLTLPIVGGNLPPVRIDPGEPSFVLQVVTPGGGIIKAPNAPALEPVISQVPVIRDTGGGGLHFRALSVPVGRGFTVMLARPLTEVDETLRTLALMMIVVFAGGVALAVGLGYAVTRTAAAPVARLSDAAERVTETGDLSLRIEEPATDDEIGRLAARFNAMMAALEGSVTAQRQLVADASHELRTPLTSVRTNIDLLASGRLTDPQEREALLRDVRTQLEELTAIVNDVVELARGSEQPLAFDDVRLDDVVREDVTRFERGAPALTVNADLRPSVVTGDAVRISRAVRNMLDNAAKWSAPGSEIEVGVTGSAVAVRDHGPGFDEQDLPHVFDRFYRATSARGMPGSGLGLAIVRQVAEAHGGRAVAENAPGGGAIVRLELPPGDRRSAPEVERAITDPSVR
ncbi:MAG TPA: HAMP domain-containing sensor histidine kinase [Actinomycetota bacterium]|nr:HAMP domain-containing sensor histidine kinase [Actinomycetota bacterium]